MESFAWTLFLYVIPAVAKLQELSKVGDFSVTERTMGRIFESCYDNNDFSNPIVIFGDFNEFIDGASIIRLNNSLNVDRISEKHQLLDFKANKIVLIGESPEKIQLDLEFLKKSKWWNHMAPLFIIGKSKEACEKFKEILVATWRMDLINSIYICPQLNVSALYTLNPIANYAPHPWNRLEGLHDLNLFRQVFDPNTSCRTLSYDKTRFLNGYEIKALAFGLQERIYGSAKNYTRETPQQLQDHETGIFHVMIDALNASFVIKFEASPHRVMESLDTGTSDMTIDMEFVQWSISEKSLYSYYWTRVIAVVESNSEISTLHKIIHLWSPPVLILALIALLILSAVLMIISSDFSLAMLDIIRLLTYVSIRTNTRSNSFRIYYLTMLILMVISNGVFQGKIASFLTIPARIGPIETIDELIKLRYKLHVHPGYKEEIESLWPGFDVNEVPRDICIKFLLNSTSHACLVTKEQYWKMYATFPVELVKEPVIETYLNHKCRENWPLYERVDSMWRRIVECGIFNYLQMKLTSGSMYKRRAYEIERMLPRYRPVKLVKLSFAFQLLAIGLSLAAVAFLLELFVAKYRTRCKSLILKHRQ